MLTEEAYRALAQVGRAREHRREALARLAQADRWLNKAIVAAHDVGAPWRRIGDVADISGEMARRRALEARSGPRE